MFYNPRNRRTPSRWDQRRFVVKEHHASRLHWDFRLEINGVLKSLVLRRPPCRDPRLKLYAKQVGDHSLKWIHREGLIPPGHYGAGMLRIWDLGMYFVHDASPLEAWDRGELLLTFYGKRMYGTYRLVRINRSKNEWMLQKCDDEYAMPGHTAPILGKDSPQPVSAAARQFQLAFNFPSSLAHAGTGHRPIGPRRRRY